MHYYLINGHKVPAEEFKRPLLKMPVSRDLSKLYEEINSAQKTYSSPRFNQLLRFLADNPLTEGWITPNLQKYLKCISQ